MEAETVVTAAVEVEAVEAVTALMGRTSTKETDSLSKSAVLASSLCHESATGQATSVNFLDEGTLGDSLGNLLYSANQQANEAVQDQLSALTATSLAIIFVAGLVIKVLLHVHSTPLTFGYIGAFGTGINRAQLSATFQLSMMHFGQGLPVAASGLAIVMGLNLLEVIEHQLPSFFNNFDPRAAAANFPSSNARVQAYLAGLTIALAASPCSTPVLATLLGYVATSRDPVVGGSLLLTYTTGYVAPIIPAASFARALQVIMCTIVFNK
ncbi:hypothetical protein YC2023_035520 [Brassica napus]